MIRVLLLAFLLLSKAAFADSGASFDLSRIKASEVVALLYRDVLTVPYVLDESVLASERIVSFRASVGKQTRRDVLDLLDGLGFEVQQKNGVDFVSVKPEVDAGREVFVYVPKYRDASFLIELTRSLFRGGFTVTRAVRAESASGDRAAPAGTAAALVDRGTDVLVFSGSESEVLRLRQLLRQVDTRQGEVMVRAIVYEVGSTDKEGSAFSLAMNVLGGKLSVVGGALTALDNAVRFKSASIDAVFSALSADSRFKVVSSPSLRVRSGASGRFSVGQEVPVLGAVTYPSGSAAPVQSVDYRSSGVIFELQPVVRDGVVDLQMSQQVSNFIVTNTGVNGSPTLTKREVKTSLSLEDGEIVLIGGLTQDSRTAATNGLSFLPSFMRSQSEDKSASEILVVLQVTRI